MNINTPPFTINKVSDYFKYIILGVLIYFPVFGHLDTLPIRIWDESRQAINAYEMYHNSDYIVTHFEGKPDMWNTKPPFLIWTQVILMKTIGINELAVRLPSAFAAFFTCLALLLFSIKYLKNFWFGFIVIVVLITSHGYIKQHATRTGDYDALLTLFTTLSGLFFFAFTETKKFKYLYLFFFVTTLAALTKSISGVLFLPAILIYTILQKQFLFLLKSKQLYIGISAFIGVVIGYYLLREYYNNGYITAVYENDLGGRFLESLDNHNESIWFYYDNFINFQLTAWHLLIPCGLVTGFVIKNEKINRITLFSTLMILTFLLVVSTAQTKLEWYAVPLYPFLAIIIAVFIYYIFSLLENLTLIKQTLNQNIMPYAFLFLICITPYQRTLDVTYLPNEYNWDKNFYEIGYFLKDAVKGKHDLNNEYILYDGYYAHNLFYLNILKDKGVKVSFKNWEKLSPMDVVTTQQDNIKQYIETNYKHEIIRTIGNIITYKIDGKK